MRNLKSNSASRTPLKPSMKFVTVLLSLLTITFVSALTVSAQNSTNSIPTNENPVVTIGGKKYVLVPEKTFGKIEKLTDELPALRIENAELKAAREFDAKIAAKDAQIITSLTSERDALQKALDSETAARVAEGKRADSEAAARVSNEKALVVSEADRTRLQKSLKKARKIGVVTTVASIILGGLLLF